MGKQKQAADVVKEVEASEPEKLPDVVPIKQYRVQLSAHTHIEHNNVIIESRTPEDAKKQFCAMNGISDSTCPWSITEVKE